MSAADDINADIEEAYHWVCLNTMALAPIDTSPALWLKPSNLNPPRYRKEPYDAG